MDKNYLDERFDKIDVQLEKIHTIQVTQTIELTSQGKDLKHHITRTNELQEIVTPLQIKYQQVLGGIKLVVGIVFIVGAAATIIKILEFLSQLK